MLSNMCPKPLFDHPAHVRSESQASTTMSLVEACRESRTFWSTDWLKGTNIYRKPFSPPNIWVVSCRCSFIYTNSGLLRPRIECRGLSFEVEHDAQAALRRWWRCWGSIVQLRTTTWLSPSWFRISFFIFVTDESPNNLAKCVVCFFSQFLEQTQVKHGTCWRNKNIVDVDRRLKVRVWYVVQSIVLVLIARRFSRLLEHIDGQSLFGVRIN